MSLRADTHHDHAAIHGIRRRGRRRIHRVRTLPGRQEPGLRTPVVAHRGTRRRVRPLDPRRHPGIRGYRGGQLRAPAPGGHQRGRAGPGGRSADQGAGRPGAAGGPAERPRRRGHPHQRQRQRVRVAPRRAGPRDRALLRQPACVAHRAPHPGPAGPPAGRIQPHGRRAPARRRTPERGDRAAVRRRAHGVDPQVPPGPAQAQ
ncbi:Uncharacterised protein [Bordetella pertussis]|nr:Uncharacterised protein [Bordetella pertussis]CFM17077.1 Uncharacterised protein [Bordetella pertussis]CFM35299.1 Uncharacterised protein [Bordetella pertussis]CFM60728.1 Uncharacterised protein [Bordetella pertussis]CFM88821.1 Uncharacterised protein [Bordetella pertussis]